MRSARLLDHWSDWNVAVRLNRVDSVCDPGHSVNEDIYGNGDHLAWVIDGASTKETNETTTTEASIYVEALSAAFHSRAGAIERQDATEVLRKVASAVPLRGTNDSQPTSCSVAILRADPIDDVSFAILGDVEVVHYSARHKRAHIVADQVALHREESHEHHLRKLMQDGIGVDRAREEIWEVEDWSRKHEMNRIGGYWRLSGNSDVIDHALTGRLSPSRNDVVLICSDGFSRLYRMFNVASARELIKSVVEGEKSLLQWLTLLRTIESRPESVWEHPRMSRHDDATALLLEIAP